VKNGLIKRGNLADGYSLTYQGFDEIESAILNPHVSTSHFPPSIAAYANTSDNFKAGISEIKQKRASFLRKAYDLSNEDTTIMINQLEVGKLLNIDDITIRKIMEYLEASGRIEYLSSELFTISQLGVIEVEGPLQDTADIDSISLWVNLYPTLETAYDIIIHLLEDVNTKCKAKFGCIIFNANAKTLKEFRNDINSLKADSRNKNAFTLLVARVASIIDDVDSRSLLQRVSQCPDNNQSLNLIECLFNSNRLNYDKSLFNTLRLLRSLRNKIPPIHLGEHDAIKIYQFLSIDHSSDDWGKAADTYVAEFIACLKNMASALN
jgi:hypothetical protein